jgi:hypothetical protein
MTFNSKQRPLIYPSHFQPKPLPLPSLPSLCPLTPNSRTYNFYYDAIKIIHVDNTKIAIMFSNKKRYLMQFSN